ncbi:histone H1.2-like [Canis lupus familiaris]|uniref:histone H1.2-like n=1 Tax=Canis lupus familiaris TaxID=9615 RepID=UPI0018F7D15C|nr:histone H1.2-like [Canis lupus familiaris]
MGVRSLRRAAGWDAGCPVPAEGTDRIALNISKSSQDPKPTVSKTAPAAPPPPRPNPTQKTPVKKAHKTTGAAKRKASGPPVSELITKAVAASKERSGVSLAALKKALAAAGYDVEKNNSRIKLGLKSLVSKGTLVQTKGTGASGSFKLNKKAASGEAKPKARKAGAAKPKRAAGTAKKPKKAAGTGTPKKSAKKTPKKAKKPATATVTKKVAKSPKKEKAAKAKAAKPNTVAAKK